MAQAMAAVVSARHMYLGVRDRSGQLGVRAGGCSGAPLGAMNVMGSAAQPTP